MNAARILPLSAVVVLTLAFLAACQSLPSNSPMLERARSDYRAAAGDPKVRELAKVQLRQASDAMYEAERAWARNEDVDEIEHLSYMAKQRVAIAQETATRVCAERTGAGASDLRERIRLGARTVDAEVPRLAEPGAKTTDRGTVTTLGDMLFDTGQSQLKADGLRSVDWVVGYLNRYPLRKAKVDGFTDSNGSAASNVRLSGRRADAARDALVQRGVSEKRITARGNGEAFPTASNDTSAGRQVNRRVEIILSDDAGNVVAR